MVNKIRCIPELGSGAASFEVWIGAVTGFHWVSDLTRPDTSAPPPMVLLVHGGPWSRSAECVWWFHGLWQDVLECRRKPRSGNGYKHAGSP
jgi:hypothetical protein